LQAWRFLIYSSLFGQVELKSFLILMLGMKFADLKRTKTKVTMVRKTNGQNNLGHAKYIECCAK